MRDGQGLPRFVEQESRDFLTCGCLAAGFARFRCPDCRFDRLVPFSCKGRGFCPSCGGRRMTDRAAHLIDHVFPAVPIRQWVLTMPPRPRINLVLYHGVLAPTRGVAAGRGAITRARPRRTFELTPIGHAQKLFIVPYADTWIPVWMLWATGSVIPVVELVAGWMVVIGWRVRECLVALGLILIIVTYGHLLFEPLFNFNGHVIPRTLMLLVVAFTPRDADWFSVDCGLGRRARPQPSTDPI